MDENICALEILTWRYQYLFHKWMKACSMLFLKGKHILKHDLLLVSVFWATW